MKDEIIIRTLMDTEIGVLEEFVKKVEDSPKILEDDKFVSRADFDILKGHLGTLKKLRETSWRAIKMDGVHDRNHTAITLSNGEQVYMDVPKDMVGITESMPINWQTNADQKTCCATVLKTENYPGQFENLIKERDNWRDMYGEALKKNETLGHKILLVNYDRDMKIERLKKENDELSRINSIRLGDINRLQDKIDILELQNKSLEDEKNASLSKEFKKSKEFKEILVRECFGRPYYEILYEEDGQMHVGYSSYKLDKVSEWLKEFFID